MIAAFINPAEPFVGQAAVISGTLTAACVTLPGQPVTLFQALPSGAFPYSTPVEINNTTTDTSGSFAFTVMQHTPGHLEYEVGFPSSAMYARTDELLYPYFQQQSTAITATATPTKVALGTSALISGSLTTKTEVCLDPRSRCTGTPEKVCSSPIKRRLPTVPETSAFQLKRGLQAGMTMRSVTLEIILTQLLLAIP